MSYTRRLRAERRLSRLPMPMPAAMLSDNHKTHTSINLSVLNCRPAVPGAAWENTAYSVEDLARALIERRVSVEGVFVRTCGG